MKNKPNPIPAAIPNPRARPRFSVPVEGARDTNQMPATAMAKPASCSAVGRPSVAIPKATGNTAPTTPEVGALVAMWPAASPR